MEEQNLDSLLITSIKQVIHQPHLIIQMILKRISIVECLPYWWVKMLEVLLIQRHLERRHITLPLQEPMEMVMLSYRILNQDMTISCILLRIWCVRQNSEFPHMVRITKQEEKPIWLPDMVKVDGAEAKAKSYSSAILAVLWCRALLVKPKLLNISGLLRVQWDSYGWEIQVFHLLNLRLTLIKLSLLWWA